MTFFGARRTGSVRALVAAMLVLLLTGCGVPMETAPDRLSSPDVSGVQVTPTSSPSPDETSGAVAQIFFVQQGRLVSVTRVVSDAELPGPVLDALLAGPTPAEVARSVTTAIPVGTPPLEVTVIDSTASIVVPPSFETLQVAEQILVVAQLVYTLTDIGGITGLQMTHGTEAIEIPTGDGRLTPLPVFRAAYSSLAPGGPSASVPATSPPVRQGGP